MVNTRLVFEEILQVGGNVAAKPTGSSMYPVIVTGDKLRVSPPGDLKKGDIILYKSGDLMVCHRLVRTFRKDGKASCQTRGDSSLSPDEPVAAADVLGKVTRIERRKCTPARKVLLLMHPVLRYGRLNAYLFTFLTRVRVCLERSLQTTSVRGEVALVTAPGPPVRGSSNVPSGNRPCSGPHRLSPKSSP